MSNVDIDIWLYDVGGKISSFDLLSGKEMQEKNMVFMEVRKNIEKLDKDNPKVKKVVVASEIYRKARTLYSDYSMVQALNKYGYTNDAEKEQILKTYDGARANYEYNQIKTRNEVNQILDENGMTIETIKETVEKFSLFIDEIYSRYCYERGEKNIGSFVEKLFSAENNLKKSASKR